MNSVFPKDSLVKTDLSGEFVSFTSPYFALVCAKNSPMVSYLGIESGGRSRRLLDKSLLRSGLGGTLICGDQTSFAASSVAKVYSNGVSYNWVSSKSNMSRNLKITATNEHGFAMQITAGDGTFSGEFFRLATAPDVSPVSIWAVRSNEIPSNQYDRPVTFYSPRIIKASWKLPVILHFPDYGLVKIEASDTNIYLQEHFVPDYSNLGLALGPFNRGAHNAFRAYHLGTIMLSFHSSHELTEANIKFTVLDENYPKIQGCDFSDPKFNGLKRCWQNSFPVNPEQQCMGDNLLLNGIAHLSMAFKADMAVFTPPLSGKESISDALGRALDSTFSTFSKHINPKTGRVMDYGWESTETCLTSLYDYLLITNNWALIRRNLPNIRRAVQSVMNCDVDGDGIMEASFHGNSFEDNRTSLNWWDDFAFGYKDAYTNILAYRALKQMNEIFTCLKLDADVKQITAFTNRFRSVFHKTFFNPKTGVYAGWISKDGHMHDYMFTFISSMAINQGLVEKNLGKEILKKMLIRMDKLGYDFVYGVPGPLIPVDINDKGRWEEMTRWGRYENGGLCGQTAYHFIQALYQEGMRKEADKILFTMMDTFEREPTHSGLFPGYLRSVDWRTKGGAPTGYNYLADNYYFLLAAVTGHFGVKYPLLQKPD